MLSRKDSWANFLTGVGNNLKDKRMASAFHANAGLQEDELNALYRNEGMGRRIIEVLSEDMTRKWFKVEGDTNGDMEKEFKKFNGLNQIQESLRWALLHGGSIGVIGVNDGGLYEDPVNEQNIDSVSHIHIFDRWRVVWNSTDIYNDPYNPKFGEPEFYTIYPISPGVTKIKSKGVQSDKPKVGSNVVKNTNSSLSGTFRVHESRVLKFDGVLIPLKERIQNGDWNDSYLQSCYERIRGLGEAYAGLETIIQEFIIGTMTIKDLAQMISAGKENLAIRRLDLLDRSKHIMNTLLLDENEEYERHTATVSGLDDLIDALVLGISAASGVPVTILMGQAPAGLNATGASDVRRYYDKISGMQQAILLSPLEKICKYVMLSKTSRFKGKEIEDWSIKFPSLWALDEVQEADVRLRMAQADGLYIDRKVLSQEEVAKSRFGGEQYSFETHLCEERDEKGCLPEETIERMIEIGAGPVKDMPDDSEEKGSKPKQRAQEGNKKL